MSSEWIERRKKQLSLAAQQQQTQARHAGIIAAKAGDWMRAFAHTMQLQMSEAVNELGQKLEFKEQHPASFAVYTQQVYPAISVLCDLDVAAQCIRFVFNRTETSSSGPTKNERRAEFAVNGGDALIVTFGDRKYLEPEHLAAHVLELALYNEEPPPQTRIGMS